MSKIKQQQLSFSSPCAIEASNSSLRNRLRSASFPGSLKKTIRVAWMDMLAEIASFFQICLVLGCIPDTFRIQQQRVSLTNTSILFFSEMRIRCPNPLYPNTIWAQAIWHKPFWFRPSRLNIPKFLQRVCDKCCFVSGCDKNTDGRGFPIFTCLGSKGLQLRQCWVVLR